MLMGVLFAGQCLRNFWFLHRGWLEGLSRPFVQIRFPGEKAARQIRGGNLENIHPAGQPFDAAGVVSSHSKCSGCAMRLKKRWVTAVPFSTITNSACRRLVEERSGMGRKSGFHIMTIACAGLKVLFILQDISPFDRGKEV